MHRWSVVVDRVVVPDEEIVADRVPIPAARVSRDPGGDDCIAGPEEEDGRIQLESDAVEVRPLAGIRRVAPVERRAKDHADLGIRGPQPTKQLVHERYLVERIEPRGHIVERDVEPPNAKALHPAVVRPECVDVGGSVGASEARREQVRVHAEAELDPGILARSYDRLVGPRLPVRQRLPPPVAADRAPLHALDVAHARVAVHEEVEAQGRQPRNDVEILLG